MRKSKKQTQTLQENRHNSGHDDIDFMLNHLQVERPQEAFTENVMQAIRTLAIHQKAVDPSLTKGRLRLPMDLLHGFVAAAATYLLLINGFLGQVTGDGISVFGYVLQARVVEVTSVGTEWVSDVSQDVLRWLM